MWSFYLQTLYCVSVPAESPWVREEHRRRSAELSPPTPGSSKAQQNKLKRIRDCEDSQMETSDSAANGNEKQESGLDMEMGEEETERCDSKKVKTDSGQAVNSGRKASTTSE